MTSNTDAALYTGSATPAINYAALLRGLEQYGHVIVANMDMHGHDSNIVDVNSRYSKNIAALIDGGPLYSISESAENRCHMIWDELKTLGTPTIPVDGATFATSKYAMFVRQIDDPSLAEMKMYENVVGGTYFSSYEYCAAAVYPKTSGTRESVYAFARGIVSRVRRHSDSHRVSVAVSGDVILYPESRRHYHLAQHRASLSPTIVTELTKPVPSASRITTFDNNGKETQSLLSSEQGRHWTECFMKYSASTLFYLLFVDMPTNYIIEERPSHVKAVRGPMRAKLSRLDDRERWIVLDPEEARVLFSSRTDRVDHGGSHASPVLHLRRGHTMTLRSERYRFRRGEVIYRRPTWVGDREWSCRKLNYRVVSRLGAEDTQA